MLCGVVVDSSPDDGYTEASGIVVSDVSERQHDRGRDVRRGPCDPRATGCDVMLTRFMFAECRYASSIPLVTTDPFIVAFSCAVNPPHGPVEKLLNWI